VLVLLGSSHHGGFEVSSMGRLGICVDGWFVNSSSLYLSTCVGWHRGIENEGWIRGVGLGSMHWGGFDAFTIGLGGLGLCWAAFDSTRLHSTR